MTTTVQQLKYPNTEGYRFSHGSVRILRGPDEVFGFKEIKYKPSVEEGEVRLHGRKPLGRTRGNVSYEASIVFGIEEFYNFVAALGDGFLDAIFSLAVIRSEGDVTVTDELISCRLKAPEIGSSNGPDPQEVSCDLTVQDMTINGLKPVL